MQYICRFISPISDEDKKEKLKDQSNMKASSWYRQIKTQHYADDDNNIQPFWSGLYFINLMAYITLKLLCHYPDHT